MSIKEKLNKQQKDKKNKQAKDIKLIEEINSFIKTIPENKDQKLVKEQISIIKLAYVKNAPLGYNSYDSDSDKKKGYYNRYLERSLNYAIIPSLNDDTLLNHEYLDYTGYFRVPDSAGHPLRTRWNIKITKKLNPSLGGYLNRLDNDTSVQKKLTEKMKPLLSFVPGVCLDTINKETALTHYLKQGESVEGSELIVKHSEDYHLLCQVIDQKNELTTKVEAARNLISTPYRNWIFRYSYNQSFHDSLWNISDQGNEHHEECNDLNLNYGLGLHDSDVYGEAMECAGQGLNLIQLSYLTTYLLKDYKHPSTPSEEELRNATSAYAQSSDDKYTESSTVYYTVHFNQKTYKQLLLEDRRKLIKDFGEKDTNYSCGSSKFKIIKSGLTKEREGFYLYPCLVFEPVDDTENPEPWACSEREKNVEQLKGWLHSTVSKNNGNNNSNQLSLANRASFGFPYPAIGDVSKSVRIWPGLLPAQLITRYLNPIINVSTKIKIISSDWINSPIVQAGLRLVLVTEYLSKKETDQLKKGKWPLKHLIKNKNKFLALIEYIKSCEDIDTQANNIATQLVRTVENINELNLVVIAMLPKNITENEFSMNWEAKYRIQGYSLTLNFSQVTFHNSGMAALWEALKIGGLPNTDGPNHVYYESDMLFDKENPLNLALRQKSKDYKCLVECIDLAYNFTSLKDAEAERPKALTDEGETIISIYDATNVTRVEIMHDVIKRYEVKTEIKLVVIIFESLSKHFQFGMDKTTLGRLEIYTAGVVGDDVRNRIRAVEVAPLPMPYKTYVNIQSFLFEATQDQLKKEFKLT
ncbi:MAG: hypothetical protein ACI9LM_003746 [Alteromonadaceae bacterium]|jgi:uncharacterized protein YgiM (DUF1202 family)